MAGTLVPRWWLHTSGMLLARERQFMAPTALRAIEEETGVRLPRNRRLLLAVVRMLLGGY